MCSCRLRTISGIGSVEYPLTPRTKGEDRWWERNDRGTWCQMQTPTVSVTRDAEYNRKRRSTPVSRLAPPLPMAWQPATQRAGCSPLVLLCGSSDSGGGRAPARRRTVGHPMPITGAEPSFEARPAPHAGRIGVRGGEGFNTMTGVSQRAEGSGRASNPIYGYDHVFASNDRELRYANKSKNRRD